MYKMELLGIMEYVMFSAHCYHLAKNRNIESATNRLFS